MKIWQRNAVVATVVLFVAVSIYLSWSYGGVPAEDLPVYRPHGDISATVTAPPGADRPLDQAPDTALEGEAKESAYFAEARMSRQRARDNALSLLSDAAARIDATQDIKDQASHEIQTLAQQAMAEASIEGLVKAKGFADCVVYINADGISLVVSAPEGGMTANDVAKIKDICLSETSFGIESIKIIEV